MESLKTSKSGGTTEYSYRVAHIRVLIAYGDGDQKLFQSHGGSGNAKQAIRFRVNGRGREPNVGHPGRARVARSPTAACRWRASGG